jgi:hypothetical protein
MIGESSTFILGHIFSFIVIDLFRAIVNQRQMFYIIGQDDYSFCQEDQRCINKVRKESHL